MFWPAAQVLNFAVVPLSQRVTFISVLAVGWNAVLSYINSKPMVIEVEKARPESNENADETIVVKHIPPQ